MARVLSVDLGAALNDPARAIAATEQYLRWWLEEEGFAGDLLEQALKGFTRRAEGSRTLVKLLRLSSNAQTTWHVLRTCAEAYTFQRYPEDLASSAREQHAAREDRIRDCRRRSRDLLRAREALRPSDDLLEHLPDGPWLDLEDLDRVAGAKLRAAAEGFREVAEALERMNQAPRGRKQPALGMLREALEQLKDLSASQRADLTGALARDFLDEAADAQRLAAGPPPAYRYMKRNLNLALTLHERELLDLESEAMMRTGATEDFRNAAAAFLAKKTPTFEGR